MITVTIANVVWPALILEQRLLSIVPITLGLLVEWRLLWSAQFQLTWKRAALVALAMNAASTLIGIPLIPALGFAWEYFPGDLIYRKFELGTFNPFTWAATLLIAVFVNALVEASVLKWLFRVPLNHRRFWLLLAANIISVAAAYGSLWIWPPKW